MIRIPPQRGGWLEVICGPMFSGKSEEMIRRLRRAEIAGQRVVIFKPQDRRPLRRDRRRQPRGRADACRPGRVGGRRARARAQGFDVVGIDEVQFLEHVDRRARARARRRAAFASSRRGSTRTSGASRSARCRSSSPTPSSSTSCRPSATAAAARRRRRSGSSTASRRRTRERRSSSALPSSTKRAAATATRPGVGAALVRRLAAA